MKNRIVLLITVLSFMTFITNAQRVNGNDAPQNKAKFANEKGLPSGTFYASSLRLREPSEELWSESKLTPRTEWVINPEKSIVKCANGWELVKIKKVIENNDNRWSVAGIDNKDNKVIVTYEREGIVLSITIEYKKQTCEEYCLDR